MLDININWLGFSRLQGLKIEALMNLKMNWYIWIWIITERVTQMLKIVSNQGSC
jgi:hypothetical protein